MMVLAILSGMFLAYANGANDNFKGVATLFGSGASDYRKALLWATITTFAGSLVAFDLAQGLLSTFTGKGLIPDNVIALPFFPQAVVLASAATIMLATRLGFPISTTHALTGALLGAGHLASLEGVNFSKLGSSFLAPLLVSPLFAIAGTVLLYPLLKLVRNRIGIEKNFCLCIGTEVLEVLPNHAIQEQGIALSSAQVLPILTIETEAKCQERYFGRLLGIDAGQAMDTLHYLSAGIVSFARGLNDTPKIAALLLVSNTIPPSIAIIGVGIAMASGGLLHARKVANTLSFKVTAMNSGQGFTANLVTGAIVIFASKFGLPVSTTHVSCGALFGIGTITRQANLKTIAQILIAWGTTLPIAAILSALVFTILRSISA